MFIEFHTVISYIFINRYKCDKCKNTSKYVFVLVVFVWKMWKMWKRGEYFLQSKQKMENV